MKDTFGEKIFYAINYAMLVIVGLLCLAPVMHVVSLALSSGHAVQSGDVGLFPVEFTLLSIKDLLEGSNAVKAFYNSIVITTIGVSLSMVGTILLAYPLSKKYLIGRSFWSKIAVFTMFFSGGIIPSYLIIREMGMMGHYSSLWIPGLVSTYNMLILKTFFEGMPPDIEEAAIIDGCSEVRLIVQIFLPLSLPVLATLTLFYTVSYWNMFMPVLMYITDAKKHNLAVLIQTMIKSQTIIQEIAASNPDTAAQLTPEGVKAAGIVLMLIPMLVIYPFIQKFFVKGVMIGAIKG